MIKKVEKGFIIVLGKGNASGKYNQNTYAFINLDKESASLHTHNFIEKLKFNHNISNVDKEGFKYFFTHHGKSIFYGGEKLQHIAFD